MDNSSNFDENSEVGYQPSHSSVDQNDHSISETVEYSPFSGESFAYCRTNSESDVSNLSEAIDDNSYASESSPSPSPWMVMKHGASPAVLSRLGMKQRRYENKSDDLDLLESGWFPFCTLCVVFVHFSCVNCI